MGANIKSINLSLWMSQVIKVEDKLTWLYEEEIKYTKEDQLALIYKSIKYFQNEKKALLAEIKHALENFDYPLNKSNVE